MTTPAGPDARARARSTPITRAGEEGAMTRAGTAPNRSCGRTTTPAGPSPRPRPGATPSRRPPMTILAGAVAEVRCRIAARPATTDFVPRGGFTPRTSLAASPGLDLRQAPATPAAYAPQPGPAPQA